MEENTTIFHGKVDQPRPRLGVAEDERILRPTEHHSHPLPEVKGVPFQRNAKFLGREQVLIDLDCSLENPASSHELIQRACVIHGLGGVGKTQTALEYTYRYRYEYSYILWVKAESHTLAASYGNLAQELAPSLAGADQSKNADVVRNWLIENDSWLLIFDNVDDSDLNRYWPPSSHGSIIITTQLQSVAHQFTSAIKLDTFDEDMGSKLILDLTDPSRGSTTAEDIKTTKLISNELGGLPILLSHVAGYIDMSKCTLKDLLKSLQEPSSFRKIWAYDSTASTNIQYGEHMEKAWKLALNALTSEAITTLEMMAFLDADGVKEDILIGDWSDPELSFLSPKRRFDFNDVRQSLVDRHLVTVTSVNGQMVLSIHRSLKQHLLHLINEADRSKFQIVFNRALQIIQQNWPTADELQAPRAESWRECESCLPHILSLVSMFPSWAPKIEGTQEWCKMLADAVVYMWERGLAKACLKLIDLGEQVCSHLNDAGDVAAIHADLCAVSAALAQDSGYRGRDLSLRQCQKALQLRQKQVDELREQHNLGKADVLRLANAWNDVGVTMMHDGDFENATPFFEQSLKLKREWADEDSLPWHFGETYKNLAFVSLARKDIEEAKAYAHRATQLCSSNLPELSAAVQKARHIEGLVVMICGERDRALRIHKAVLEARKEILGLSNPFTKDSFYTVGELYRLKGKWNKAELNFRTVLKDSDGWTEEAKARTKHRLALVIRCSADLSSQRIAEAQTFEADARKAREAYIQTKGEANGVMDEFQIHDMTVSLWAGRMSIAAPPADKDLETLQQIS